MIRQHVIKRFYWNSGKVGDGIGYSAKLSLSWMIDTHNFCVGFHFEKHLHEWYLWIHPIPLMNLRIHFRKAYGGIYPTAI